MNHVKQRLRQNAGAVIALLVLILITFVFAPFSWHFPDMRGITAEISTDGQHLIVKNGNDFIWENTTITINEQFQYRIALFPRGGSSISMNEFVNAAGNKFDSDRQTLRAVTITVPHVPEGGGGYFRW